MKLFTIVTGIIGIIGFLLGFNNTFPEYSSYLLYCGFICIGLVMGLIISIFDKNIQIKPYELTIDRIFVFSFYGFIGVLLIILLLKQPQYFESIIGGIGLFILFTFGHLLPIISGNSTLSISERKVLADKYEQDKNYSLAIYHYNKISESLSSDDERMKTITDKISELKKKQLE